VLVLGSASRLILDNHFCLDDYGVLNSYSIGLDCGGNDFCELLTAELDQQPRRDNANSYGLF
tara:strand:- start:1229 stop:1414 length:186 start_codon:yes stop_codon:yes gene_type:complete